MTTAVNGVTARSILTRADKRWADNRCDDPAAADYIDHLAKAVQNHIDGLTPAPVADDAELRRLNDRVAELQKTIDARDHELTRRQGETTALTAERDQLRAAVDELRADVHARVDKAVAKAVAAGKGEVDSLRARIDDLRVDLAQAQRDTQTWKSEYERVRDEKLDDIVERAQPVHEHRYPIDPDTLELEPCTCGLVYPRDTLAAHQAAAQDDDVVDDTEPISVVLDRVRAQLAGWGETR